MSDYDKPPELYDGLRLHQNENTAGCSPRVLSALRALSTTQIALYPPYEATVRACAKYFGVDPSGIALTNGLDEGILATSMAYLKTLTDGTQAEAIVPEPAFDIFAYAAELVGGRVIHVPPRPAFDFPEDAVVAAISPRTRLVFITNPNNPTGVPVSLEAIRTVASRLPPEAVIFLDEAYADFSGTTFIPELARVSNIVVGRTFSKAHGLAALRVGAVIGAASVLAPIRRAIPVYSVNVAATVAVTAAIEDQGYVREYVGQVTRSKALVYEMCDRLGLKYWPSAANFVLVHVGPDVASLVSRAASRGVYLRDRSNEPGCEGCVRITAGVVEHTMRGLAVVEELLCAAQ